MALQTKINGRQVPGIAGEFSDASPKSARQYIVYGTDGLTGAVKPMFGKFFSLKDERLSTGSSKVTTVAVQGIGSTSWSVGILVNPKEHFTNGFVTTLACEPCTAGTIATRGHIWVMASTDTVAGEPVFVDANGNIGSEDLASSTKVIGAKWLKSAKSGSLSEVAIDNPTLKDETGPGSLGSL